MLLLSSVQSLSHVRLFAIPWIAACQASLSITNSRSSPRLTSIESVMPSSHLILCRPLLLPLIPPSIRVFSNESTLRMRWPKHKDIWSLFCKNFTWNIIHKNTELFCCIYETNIVNQVYFLKTILQGIFLTQGLNPGLLHWRQML